MILAMPPAMTPEEIERLAHRRASRKMGWYMHACVYVLVNAYLFFGSYFGWRERAYDFHPMLGWGLAVALHFISVFVLGRGSGFREQIVQRERERIQREQNRP
jgi:hypothetical protein